LAFLFRNVKIKVEPGEGQALIPSEQLQSKSQKSPEVKKVLPGVLLSIEEPAGLSTAQLLGTWGLVYLFTFSGLGFYAYRQVGRRKKREDLRQQIQRRVKSLDGYLAKNEWRQVGIEAINLISAVLGEIAGMGGASFEFDRLVEKSPPSFKREVAPHLKVVLAKLEIVGFAPEGIVGNMRDKKELKKLISETEKWLIKSAQYDFSSLEKPEKDT
jgi:hypothetical protein